MERNFREAMKKKRKLCLKFSVRGSGGKSLKEVDESPEKRMGYSY